MSASTKRLERMTVAADGLEEALATASATFARPESERGGPARAFGYLEFAVKLAIAQLRGKPFEAPLVEVADPEEVRAAHVAAHTQQVSAGIEERKARPPCTVIVDDEQWVNGRRVREEP